MALLSSVCGLLMACENYQVLVNDRAVYTPPPLLAGFTMEDESLRACVEQTIRDAKIRHPDELKQLICTSAGIDSLVGLHLFSQLEQINLADNNVQGLDPLTTLEHLTALSLKNNRVTVVTPLTGRQNLAFLDLSGNKELKCDQLETVAKTLADNVQLIAPDHC